MVGEKERALDPELGPKTAAERAYVAQADDTLALLDLVSPESPYHPIHWPLWKKWAITIVYWCVLSLVCVSAPGSPGRVRPPRNSSRRQTIARQTAC